MLANDLRVLFMKNVWACFRVWFGGFVFWVFFCFVYLVLVFCQGFFYYYS